MTLANEYTSVSFDGRMSLPSGNIISGAVHRRLNFAVVAVVKPSPKNDERPKSHSKMFPSSSMSTLFYETTLVAEGGQIGE